ncbi:recombinase family protein [bacterium]|nr:MAG: recombinase family protein [bacterium]MCE7891546.1 recombinase family protein [Sorangiineae bacterium PRO1]
MPRASTRTNASLAVAYLRVSSGQQADSRLGLEGQRATIQRWADARGVQLVAWAEDAGLSGAVALEKRPGLMEALAALRLHRAGVLVVDKRDRIARDVVLAAMAERLVEREHARLFSAAGEGEGDEPGAVLMRHMIDAFAEYERALIGARTSSALKAKVARGERLGAARVGERLVGGSYEPEEKEAALVRRVMELRGQGRTFRAIRAQLVAEGFRGRQGRAPRLATVFAIANRNEARR